ncbi:MAG: cupin domain-containing protein [Gemmatimonadaceae bacterium]
MSRDAGEPPRDDDDARPSDPPDDGDVETGAEEDISALGLRVADAFRSGPFDAPAPSLRARILSRARLAPFSSVRQSEGIWLPAAGAPVATKELYCDSSDRLATRLVRIAAGHPFRGAPLKVECSYYIVDGEIRSAAWTEPCVSGDVILAMDAENDVTALRETLLLEFTRRRAVRTRDATKTIHSDERIVRARDRPWLWFADGIEISPLKIHEQVETLIIFRFSPGSLLDDHEHQGVEELYVLSGSCVVEEELLVRGDYHRASNGTVHATARSKEDGCTLLVSLRKLEPMSATST